MLKRLLLGCFLLLTLLPLPAFAQALADRIPGQNTLFYLGWRGTEALGPAYQQSNLKGVLDAGDVQKQFTDLFAQLTERAAKDDPGAREAAAIIRVGADLLIRKPTAFYFGGLDSTDPEKPLPRIALICRSGPDGAALAARLTQLLDGRPEAEKRDTPAIARMWGEYLFVGIGKFDDVEAFVRSEKALPANLAGTPEFTAALQQVQSDAALTLYVSMPAIVQLIDERAAATGNGDVANLTPRIVDSLGLSQIHEIIFTSSFDAKEWSTRGFIKLDKERSGLTSFIDNKPLTDEVLQALPRDLLWARAIRFDGVRLFANLRDALDRIDPTWPQMLDQGLRQGNTTLGINIENDLFGALGDAVFVYGPANAPQTDPSHGLTIVNQLKNPDAMTKTLESLQAFANGMLAIRAPMRGLEIRDTPQGDLTVHSIALPGGLTPSWTIKGNYLVVSTTTQGLTAALDAVGKGGFAQNETFNGLKKRLGVEKFSSFRYIDLPRTAPAAYAGWDRLRTVLAAQAAGENMNIPTLPPFEKIQPFLGPSLTLHWSDEAGMHMRGLEPFPCSRLLGGESGFGQLLMAQMLPALQQARAQAETVATMSKLRQIGLALMVYANDHNNTLPDGLGALLAAGAIKDPRVFVGADGQVPETIVSGTVDQQVEWVNKNGSFTFVAGGKKLSDFGNPATDILAYEKPEANKTRATLSVLYADGHVESQARAKVEALSEQK